MRLLNKSEIIQKKNAERHQEVEEGVKLAKRVDNLRSLASEEQQRISKFREESITKVKDEIASLILERAGILAEIARLAEERERLMKPLDAEWDKLKGDKQVVDKERVKITAKILQLDEAQKILEKKERDLELKEIRINNTKLETEELYKHAKLTHDQAISELNEAEEKMKQAQKFADKKYNEFTMKEAILAAREKDVEINKEFLEKKEKELNNLDKLVKDRYQTLLRTEKLIN